MPLRRGDGKIPDSIRSAPASCHPKSRTPGDCDAVIARIVVNENYFEVRMTALQRPLDDLPIVADSLHPAMTTETKGSASRGRGGGRGRTASGFTI